MKRLAPFRFALISLVAFMATGISPAFAEPMSTVILYEAPHEDLMGHSLDAGLSRSLKPDGRLGSAVFSPLSEPRRWLIDAALVEDVKALALTDVVAQEWMARLKIISAGDPVFAIPYGHPDISTARKLASNELSYYYQTSRSRLALDLGREVLINKKLGWSSQLTRVPTDVKDSYSQNKQALALLSTVVPPKELDTLRAKLAFLLSTDTSVKRRSLLRISADEAITEQNHKLRIVAGKFRLTSEHEKVPITLVNDFGSTATVELQLTALNSRIHVNNIRTVKLLPHSKIQLSVPFTVIASGSTAVLAQFANGNGELLPDSVLLTLNLSVISPAVAWFTTGAAILLLLAALAQSVRRVRRSRK
ncbi:MAG: DUF6049 family protein [Actinobacteria bacterium]|nr:DUF6049 family protein [Actinomycetota bacterium]